MTKAEKIENDYYRTADGAYEIVKYGDEYVIGELRGYRYVQVDTATTISAAQKRVAELSKTAEADAPEPEPQVDTRVADAVAEEVVLEVDTEPRDTEE